MANTVQSEILDGLYKALKKQIDFYSSDTYKIDTLGKDERSTVLTELGNIHTKLTAFANSDTLVTLNDVETLKAEYNTLILNIDSLKGAKGDKGDIGLTGAKGDKGDIPDISFLDSFRNVINPLLAKIHQKVRRTFYGLDDSVFTRVGDSTRSSLPSEWQIHDGMIFPQINFTYFNNAYPSQTALGWMNNTAVNKISEAIANSKGADGENTILEFSMGLNDYTYYKALYNTTADRKLHTKAAIKDAIQAFLTAKPKALVYLVSPNYAQNDERRVLLNEIYQEISVELNLFLVNGWDVTQSLDYTSTNWYLDETHLNQYGSLRQNFYILNKIIPADIIKHIEFSEYQLPYTNENLALSSSVKAGLYLDGGAFNSNATYRYIDISITPDAIKRRMDITHSGNRNEIYFFDSNNVYLLKDGRSADTYADGSRLVYVPANAAKMIINISTTGATYDALNEQVIAKFHKNSVHYSYKEITAGFKCGFTHTTRRNGIEIDGYGNIGKVGESLKIDVNGRMKWTV